MTVAITCPGCGVRLRAPEVAAGRTLRCPKCSGPVVVPKPSGPTADFAFAPGAGGREYSEDEGNPFDDNGPAEEPQTLGEPAEPKRGRKTAAKKKPAGYNPFDEGGQVAQPEAGPTKKRRYRKDGDYNPFGDAEADEEPDPAAEGFDFGAAPPPSSPAGEFDFGPLDPRRDDRRPR